MSGERNRSVWRTVVVGLAAGAAAGAVGLAAASVTSEESGTQVSEASGQDEGAPTQYTDSIAKSGEGMPVNAAIDQVLSTMGSKTIVGIKAMDSPSSAPDPGLPWLEVDSKGDLTEPGADVELTWEAALAQGAVADLVRVDQLATSDAIAGMNLMVETPSGAVEPLDGGTGYIAAGQIFEAQTHPQNDETTGQQVSEASKTFGLSEIDVRVLHPLGPAVIVKAVVPGDAKVDWSIDDLREAISGHPRKFEGVYIELRRPSGELLLKSGVAYRTGLGGLWFAKGQDEVFGAIHGGLPSTTDPQK